MLLYDLFNFVEAVIILWVLKPKSDIPDIFCNKNNEAENQENWMVLNILQGHMEAVYDICWSPDCTQILSGSVDTAILWGVSKGCIFSIWITSKVNSSNIVLFLEKSVNVFPEH